MDSNVTAIILAAGSGSRMNLKTTKQKLKIGNESVLERTVRIFNNCKQINSIIVVTRQDEISFAKEVLSGFCKVQSIVVGGATRTESAKNGFSMICDNCEYVAIHDAARCFVTEEDITAVINDAKKFGAATASHIISDTVKTVDSEANIIDTLDRNSLMLVQTPQIFRVDLYKRALGVCDVADITITDDNILLERIGVKVHCTDTGRNNIKITFSDDLNYAEFLVNKEV